MIKIMVKDKYSAVWVSHTSISDFLLCPRLYYLKNIYRDPKTTRKIKIISPSLSLGQVVHEVLEALSLLPKKERFNESLIKKFNDSWERVTGKKGGFIDSDSEYRYKQRGEEMIRRVMNHPGPLAELSVKINMDLPYYWLSEEEELILCGKIDWLEYLPDVDGVHIIDFKTGKNEEKEDSLQLPIYNLLATNCQKRPVIKASYWYLNYNDDPILKNLPSLEESYDRVLAIARQIKLARQLNRFRCLQGESGCSACRDYETIVNGGGEYIGLDDFGSDVYMLSNSSKEGDREGMIL